MTQLLCWFVSHLNTSKSRCSGKSGSWRTYLLLPVQNHQHICFSPSTFSWVSVAWRKIPRIRVELSFKKLFFSPMYLKAQKAIMCWGWGTKDPSNIDSESESYSHDSDSSVKHFKKTRTNLLCNYSPFSMCMGVVCGNDLYPNKSKRIFKINKNYIFKIRIA